MILVTGATGTVGNQVIRQLSDMNEHIRALVHTPAKALNIARPNVEIAYGDFDNCMSLDKAMEDIDKVFLLAQSGPDQIEHETNIVEAAVNTGVKLIVKLSVLGASPFTPITLGRWHWESEKMIERAGIPATMVRPTFFMSNVLGQAPTIKSDGKLYAPMKDGTLSFVAPEDIAGVAVAALTQPGHENRIYEITGPEELTMSEVAEKISAAIDKPIEYIDVPEETARQSGTDSGMPDWLANDMHWYYHYFSHRSGTLVTPTVARVTGRDPISFDAWLKEHAEAFR